MPTDPILNLKNAAIGYADSLLFEGLNLDIERGSWVTILGPNGSGKSTLLRALAGILPLRGGQRAFRGKGMGYVRQKLSLPPDTSLTGREFLALNTEKSTPADTNAKRGRLLDDLLLKGLLSQPLRTLSGGQVQKFILAFALWSDPDLVFLDEYTDGIDVAGKDAILRYFEKMREERRQTVVEVTHDLTSVGQFSDRVLLVKQGITYDGPPLTADFHRCLHQVYGEKSWIKGALT